MTTAKTAAGTTAPPQPCPSTRECCMCGDYGLSSELFNCKVCQFRSQHRYCSNLYPKAESYKVCNWCLISRRENRTEKMQISSDSSSSLKKNGQSDQPAMVIKKKKKNGGCENQGGQQGHQSNFRSQMASSTIKKQRLPEELLSPAARRRIVAGGGGGGEKSQRRTKAEEMSRGGNGTNIMTKRVYRNKVRRYKLLDEVSSQ